MVEAVTNGRNSFFEYDAPSHDINKNGSLFQTRSAGVNWDDVVEGTHAKVPNATENDKKRINILWDALKNEADGSDTWDKPSGFGAFHMDDFVGLVEEAGWGRFSDQDIRDAVAFFFEVPGLRRIHFPGPYCFRYNSTNIDPFFVINAIC